MALKAGDANRIIEITLVVAILFVFLLIVYFVVYQDIFLVFTKECDSQECFNQYLAQCRRARWINEPPEASWIYTIKGKSDGKCQVNVELAMIKEGTMDLRVAEKKKMDCYLPLSTIMVPGDDLSRCTGPLKETIQDLIIKKMHAHIMENLGEISEELTKVI